MIGRSKYMHYSGFLTKKGHAYSHKVIKLFKELTFVLFSVFISIAMDYSILGIFSYEVV